MLIIIIPVVGCFQEKLLIGPSTQNRKNHVSQFILLKTELTESQLYRLAIPKAASCYTNRFKNYRLITWL